MNNQNILEKVGANVRSWREAHGLSVYALAKESGVPQTTIKSLEGAKNAVSFIVLLRISKALGVGLSELVEGCLNEEDFK